MNLFAAVILGIVQGFTELFPVSSSAHLVILQSFFPDFHQPGVAFDAILHLGTLIAVAFYFRVDIWNMLTSLQPGRNRNFPWDTDTASLRKLILFLILGTIPAAFFGLFFQDQIHKFFESAQTAAFFLMVTGLLLFFSDKVTNTFRNLKDIKITDSILIGVAQAVALLPGISRSGATITTGIFLKINRQDAARFSFLLSIPAVLGAVILECGYLKQISVSEMRLYFVGFICAVIAGFISLKLFFLIIRKARMKYFAYYCWIVSIFTLLAANQ